MVAAGAEGWCPAGTWQMKCDKHTLCLLPLPGLSERYELLEQNRTACWRHCKDFFLLIYPLFVSQVFFWTWLYPEGARWASIQFSIKLKMGPCKVFFSTWGKKPWPPLKKKTTEICFSKFKLDAVPIHIDWINVPTHSNIKFLSFLAGNKVLNCTFYLKSGRQFWIGRWSKVQFSEIMPTSN